jgi:hypothetical protein
MGVPRDISLRSAAVLLVAGCGGSRVAPASLHSREAGQAGAVACRPAGPARTLPTEIRATSGLAESRRDPQILWTHNDSGNEPVLFALDAGGRIRARVRVRGADLVDWEDLGAGPCKQGACLYVADIGDNFRTRDSISIYVVPEPSANAEAATPAAVLHARYPDGPQDAEAVFVLPTGDLYIVTKGRHGPIRLYRYPTGRPRASAVVLERIRELLPRPADERDRMTAAAVSRDGRWVLLRTYRTLYFYPADALARGAAVEPAAVDLTPLGEIQGEAVATGRGGTIWLTSEAELEGDLPALVRLQCPR